MSKNKTIFKKINLVNNCTNEFLSKSPTLDRCKKCLSTLSDIIGADFAFLGFLNNNSDFIEPLELIGIQKSQVDIIIPAKNEGIRKVLNGMQFNIHYNEKKSISNNLHLKDSKQEILIPLVYLNKSYGLVIFGFKRKINLSITLLNLFQQSLNTYISHYRQKKIIDANLRLNNSLGGFENDDRNIFQRIAEKTANVLDIDIVRVWVLDHALYENERLIILKGDIGSEDGAVQTKKISEIEGGFTWNVIKSCELKKKYKSSSGFIFSKTNLELYKGFQNKNLLRTKRIKAAISTPIFVNNEIVAVITAYSKRNHYYSKDEKSLLEAISYQSSILLKNSKLLKEFREFTSVCNAGTLAIDHVHDIKHELSKMSGLFSSALSQFSSPSKARRAVADEINSLFEYLNSLFSALVQLTKEKNPPITKEYLSEMINTSKELLGGKLNGFRVRIECDDNIKINCMRTKIIQVFMNLFHNSVYAVENAKRTKKEITIRVKELNVEINSFDLQIEFEDNGEGMNFKQQYQAFNQKFTSKDEYGTGFGLLLCKRIIKDFHKGEIFVISQINEFTKFKILLNKSI